MTDTNRIHRDRPTTLERGRFTDGYRTFHVRCSSEAAPDSFQVYADGDPDSIVLVLSGLNSGELKATWGRDWRTASEAWREWVESQAFMVFYNGHPVSRPTAHSTVRATVKVCND